MSQILSRLIDNYLKVKLLGNEEVQSFLGDLIVTYSTVYCSHRKLKPRGLSLDVALMIKGRELTEEDIAQEVTEFDKSFLSTMKGALWVSMTDPETFKMLQEFITSERGGLA